jgi:uncharacterized repeat protein (TIGR01451 family)
MKKIMRKSALLLSGILASASLYAGGITTAKESGTTMVCPTITVTVIPSNVLCYGGSTGTAVANASGGKTPYTYTWNTGSTKDSIGNLATGIYTVTVTDSNSCVATATVGISQPAQLKVSATAFPVSCNGACNGSANAVIGGGTAPYSFLWSNSQASVNINNLCPGTYSVFITDANKCTVDTTGLVVSQPAAVVATASASPPDICIGSSSLLSDSVTGGTAPYTYSWAPGGNTTSSLSVSPAATTIYTLSVVDNNGCNAAPVSVTVSVNPPLNLVVSGNDTTCEGNAANIYANASGGDGNYTYTWAPGGMTGAVIQAIPLSTTTYSVTVNDGCGSVLKGTTIVAVIPSPVLTVTTSGVSTCAGGSVTLTAAGASTYSWSPAISLSASTGATIIATPSVTTTYTLIGANTIGCVDSATVVVHVINASAAFTYSGVCSGNTIAFTDESTGSINSWNWSFGDGATSTLQNPTHTFVTDGMYTVSEHITSDSGCSATVSSPVGVYPGSGFDLTGSLQICVDTPNVSTVSIQACIFNNKCTVVKGAMKLLLDTAFHITNTISDSVAHVSGDTLIWNYSNLSDTGMIHCVSLTGNTSNVSAGDSIFASLFITPLAGDSNPSNNSVTYWIKPSLNNCVGLPFDPNEKSVMPAGDISDTLQLTYTIHFQNTGTAVTHNVVVIDTLSPYVDPTTLRITSSSSQVVTTIASGHIVKFTFDNIDLPDTAKSKTSSIGILEYTIYPMNTDVGGDVIKNTAGIYFDANPVVKTNTTVSTIATKIVSVENIAAPVLNIRCFPNPFTSSTSVVFNTDGKHYLELDDMTGRVVESIECTGKQYELSGNNLAKGVYFIKAFNADRSNVAVTKVVLQ